MTCTQLDAQGNQQEVAHLMVYQFPCPVTLQFQLRFPRQAGDYFGEIALVRASALFLFRTCLRLLSDGQERK